MMLINEALAFIFVRAMAWWFGSTS